MSICCFDERLIILSDALQGYRFVVLPIVTKLVKSSKLPKMVLGELWDEVLLCMVPFQSQNFDAFIVLR